MFQDLHARLANIATADNDREDRLGVACPIKLDLWLAGGHELRDVSLVDGENSLDDGTIDVCLRSDAGGVDQVYTVAIAHIVMLRHVWPSAADEEAACAR